MIRFPWSQPLLPQVAQWLLRQSADGMPPDLSALLVVTPTRQSGRRLRDALAAAAQSAGSGLLPPRMVTPDYLLTYGVQADGVAGPEAERAAWVNLLATVDLEPYRAFFPAPPAVRPVAWLMGVAGQLIRLRALLVEHGLDCRQVAQRVRDTDFEPARWAVLAELENAYEALLRQAGLRDPGRARLQAADNPLPPEGIQHIVLAATPDPAPLALKVLEHLDKRVRVTVLCYGPDSGECFDSCGRPLETVFLQRGIPLQDGGIHLRGVADARAAGACLAARAGGPHKPVWGFGVADSDLLPRVERALRAAAAEPYNPAGIPWAESPLGRLVADLLDLLENPYTTAVTALLRNPFVSECLRLKLNRGMSAARFSGTLLTAWDRLVAQNLPANPAAAMRAAVAAGPAAATLRRALSVLRDWRTKLGGEDFAGGMRAVLGEVFSGLSFSSAVAQDRAFLEQVDALNKRLQAMEEACTLFPGLHSAVWPSLLREVCGEQRLYPERPAAAHDLNGWLELLWEDAPCLAVAGLNDGRVPESVDGDAYIPERLRVFLGMRTNDFRFARDAYLLAAMASLRAEKRGRLELIHCRNADDGTRLKPSRLFYLVDGDEAYLDRVKILFEGAPLPPSPPRRVAWTMTPPRLAYEGNLSSSKLRDYLRCPFRFYLKHVLGWKTHEAHKRELDALDFGSLLHHALEGLAEQPDECNAAAIAEHLVARLRARASARYGGDCPFPLRLQLESAEARLCGLARHEAQLRAEGWRIQRSEASWEFDCGGLPLRGRIDRIDALSATGPFRLIDYKSSDQTALPRKAHLGPVPKEESAGHLLPQARVSTGKQDAVWVDLQLPLYYHALRATLDPAAVLETGYFNLPKANEDGGLDIWTDLDDRLVESALACAQSVAAAVRAGRFWPPACINPRYDEFAAAFPDGIEGDVNPEHLLG